MELLEPALKQQLKNENICIQLGLFNGFGKYAKLKK